MTSDRKRKKAVRAHKDSHNLTYYDALQATSTGSVKRSFPRRQQATATLSAPAGALISELARFCGLRPPSGPSGTELVDATLTKLDEVPPRKVALRDDLCTTVADRHHSGSPTPACVRSAARFITALLSRLDDTGLVTAATEVGVSNGGIHHAALLARREHRRAADASRPASEPLTWIDSPEDQAARRAEDRAEQDCVTRLRDCSGATWESVDRDVLRRAVAMHLATLGDGYLTVSERPVAPLAWRRLPDGSLQADWPIPTAPRPLSALVKPAIRHHDEPTTDVEFYRPDQRQSTTTYTCYVGVLGLGATADAFDRHDIEGHLPSELAAGLAAASIIERIAADPYRARSHPYNRPLVPRAAIAPDDETTLTFDLGTALAGVTNLYTPDDPGPTDDRWEVQPHIGDDGRLNSVTALAFDNCGFPWPKQTEPACSAAVESPAFQDYLVAQGVRMTDLAGIYLAGTAAAGAGAQPLPARHTAGMTAVLSNRQLRAVIDELKHHYPAIERWTLALNDPHAAAEHLTNLDVLHDLLSGFDDASFCD